MKQDDKYFAARAEHERELAAKAVTQWVIDMHSRTAEEFERRAKAFRLKRRNGLLSKMKRLI